MVVKTLAMCVLLLLVATLIAGAYGAIHNQISYTVSSEDFTQFKFWQFGLSRSASSRQNPRLNGRFPGVVVDGHTHWRAYRARRDPPQTTL